MIHAAQHSAQFVPRISIQDCINMTVNGLFIFLLLSRSSLADEVYLKSGFVYRNVRVSDTSGTVVSFLWDTIRVRIPLRLINKIEIEEYSSGEKPAYELYSQMMNDDFASARSEQSTNRLESDRRSKRGVQMSIATRGGELHAGQFLYATDSLLLLWQGTQPFNDTSVRTWTLVLQAPDISRITIIRDGNFWSGFGTGALIGGSVGVVVGLASGNDPPGILSLTAGQKALLLGVGLATPFGLFGGIFGAIQGVDDDFSVEGNSETYKAIVQKMKNEAIFPSLPPPQLQDLVDEKYREPHHALPNRTADTDMTYSPPSPAKLHIALAGGWMASHINGDMVNAFNVSGFGGSTGGFFGPVDYPVNNSSTFTWSLGAEYDLTSQFRIGLERVSISEQQVVGKDDEVEHARAVSVNLFADYVIVPVDKLLLSRYELAVGAGVSYNWLTVNGSVSSYVGSAYIQNPSTFMFEKRAIGAALRMSLEYYITKHFSVQGKFEQSFVPSLSVPPIAYVNPYDKRLKNLAGHSVDFSGSDFSIGLRIHL